MDANQCRVLYIDDRFPTEKWLSRGSTVSAHELGRPQRGMILPPDLQGNLDAIFQVFTQVYVCRSGRTFSTKLAELTESNKLDVSPILALFDIAPDVPHDLSPFGRGRQRLSLSHELEMTGHGLRAFTFTSESDEAYGLQLLARIASDLQVQENGRLVIPIAITRSKDSLDSRRDPNDDMNDDNSDEFSKPSRNSTSSSTASVSITSRRLSFVDTPLVLKCLDAGAIDVVIDRLDQGRVLSFSGHAYRAYKAAKKAQSSFLATAKTRRQSWVGIDEQKPYAYLRESMVRKLMNRICDPESVVEETEFPELLLDEDRKATIAAEVGKWAFCAHDFSEEDLVYAASCMLHHATQMEELEKWRLSFDELVTFVQAARTAYNSFVIYHNFRHAIDVLQSVFFFLVSIGSLPPYPRDPNQDEHRKVAPVATLVKPFEALTLLIAAIGHDVGHPGVNNMFLVKLNAPLAQLYNDQSVLEAFHCAAYCQILRQHWTVVFEDRALRRLLISSILATDMGIHSDYMQQMGNLQSKIHEDPTIEGWAPKDVEINRVLTCGLLIKCADISNIARPWNIAERWTHLLQEEFAHQGEMEKEVGIESCLFGGPPEIGNMLKLANGQIGFMTLFGLPLFEGVADILPSMAFAAKEIMTNKTIWFGRAENEKRKELLKKETGFLGDSPLSPRSQSPKTLNRMHGTDGSTTEPSSYFPQMSLPPLFESSPLKQSAQSAISDEAETEKSEQSRRSSVGGNGVAATDMATSSRRSSGAFPKDASSQSTSPLQARRSSNTMPSSQPQMSGAYDGTTTTTEASTPPTSLHGGSSENERPKSQKSNAAIRDISPTSQAPDENGRKWGAMPAIKLSLPSRTANQRGGIDTATPTRRQPQPQPQPNGVTMDRSSKYTLSTVMTPASTQATSFLSQTDDDYRGPDSGKADTTTETTTERTASSSGAPESESDGRSRDTNHYNGIESSATSDGKNNFKTTILHHGQNPGSLGSNLLPVVGNGTMKTVPRKRSRLRLAFWKKDKNRGCEGEKIHNQVDD